MPKRNKKNSKATKLLFLATQIEPFLNLSSTAQFVKDLVSEVNVTQEYEIRVIMPKFGLINERTSSIHEVQRLSGINITVGNEEISLVVKVGSLKPSKIQVYFLDNECLFERKGFFHDEKGNFYTDNHNRITFINKSVLSVLTYLRWNPQIIHAIGWPWALLPMYAKNSYKSSVVLKKAKYIYTHETYSFQETINPIVLQMTKELPIKQPPTLETFYTLAKTHADHTSTLHPPAKSNHEESQHHKDLIENYKTLYQELTQPKEPKTTSAPALQSLEAASPA